VESICNRVLILNHGDSVANGSIDELKKHYGTTTYIITYQLNGLTQILKISDMDEMNRAVRDVVQGGGLITDVSVEESDLQEIFLKLVGVVN
jgi:ABC-2 type transport system ATP-binding protein